MPKKPLSASERNTLAWVCHYFREKKPPAEIARLMRQHGAELNYRDANRLIAQAIDAEFIRVVSPIDSKLGGRIRDAFSLKRVDVTFTDSIDDVASQAAYALWDLLQEEVKRGTSEVRLGFSGGHTIRRTFQNLANLLAEPSTDLPRRITFHALVAGFDSGAPGTDPTSFFVYLSDQNPTFDTHYFLFHAPPVTQPARFDNLFKLPALAEAKKKAEHLHVVVTSAAVFEDEHSQLRRYLKAYGKGTLSGLERDGCKGDILWLPITVRGPIVMSKERGYHLRPVTLLELDDLPGRIGSGTRVLLVLGPCADSAHSVCPSKAAVLDPILHLKGGPYITDLVIDKATAAKLMSMQDNRQTIAAQAP